LCFSLTVPGSFSGAEPSRIPTLARQLEGHTDQILCLAFSPDGKLLASGCYDGVVRLWDAETGQKKGVLEARDNGIFSIAFSVDGKTLATGCGSSLILWDLGDRKRIKDIPADRSRAWSVGFSPDGKSLVYAGLNTVTIRSTKDFQKVAEVSYPVYFKTIAVSGDSDLIAVAGDDTYVLVLDAKTGKQRQKLEHGGLQVRGVAFFRNELLASGSGRTIKLWNMPVGKEKAYLEGHERDVSAVAFSKDGKILASAGLDGTIRLWSVAMGKELLSFKADGDWVGTVVWSSDGKYLASGGRDKKVKVWKQMEK